MRETLTSVATWQTFATDARLIEKANGRIKGSSLSEIMAPYLR